ncbi:E3 ubiquitin-protein ligase TRIM11-like [Liasis olivaceus]
MSLSSSGGGAVALRPIVEKLQQELTCSICFKSFLHPTTLDCGHNFCHACLVSYWGEFPIETACPQCQEKLPRLNFIPNRQLANIMKLVEELSDGIKQMTETGQTCKKHSPALKAFCRNELVLFCSMCDISQEHLAHNVVPVAEAAQEYKGHLLSCIGTLNNEKEKISNHHTEEGTQSITLIEQKEEKRQCMMAEFEEMLQFLEDQENFLLLNVVGRLEKGTFWKKSQHAAFIFQEVSAFDDLIQGLKEKCHQSTVELLQDVGSTLKSEADLSLNWNCGCTELWMHREQSKTFVNPMTFHPWVKLGLWDLFDFNAFLGNIMKQFKEALISGYQMQKANVTLDPDTAHPKLILSEDHKSFWVGEKSQELAEDDRRFDHMMCVLGHEMFLTGRHCWEVVLENEGDWAVGVAQNSMRRKGVMSFNAMRGIWAMAKWGCHWVYINPPVFSFEPMIWEIKRIQVSLNYPGCQVTFCDGESGNLLHVFPGASFSGEPICPFFWLQRKARLSFSP